jgi:predicted proteasome-type protease
MTYCVALRLDRGLVFAADTRTSAVPLDSRAHSACVRAIVMTAPSGRHSLTRLE